MQTDFIIRPLLYAIAMGQIKNWRPKLLQDQIKSNNHFGRHTCILQTLCGNFTRFTAYMQLRTIISSEVMAEWEQCTVRSDCRYQWQWLYVMYWKAKWIGSLAARSWWHAECTHHHFCMWSFSCAAERVNKELWKQMLKKMFLNIFE